MKYWRCFFTLPGTGTGEGTGEQEEEQERGVTDFFAECRNKTRLFQHLLDFCFSSFANNVCKGELEVLC